MKTFSKKVDYGINDKQTVKTRRQFPQELFNSGHEASYNLVGCLSSLGFSWLFMFKND